MQQKYFEIFALIFKFFFIYVESLFFFSLFFENRTILNIFPFTSIILFRIEFLFAYDQRTISNKIQT